MHQNAVRYMVEWVQEKPEVVAYLRYLYPDDALPDWVGKLEGDVDLRKYLLERGVEQPAIEADESPMDEDAVGVVEEEASMEGNTNDDDVQDGTPVQASTMVANEKNLPAPTDTYLHQQAPTYSYLQQDLPAPTAGPTADLSADLHAPTAEASAEASEDLPAPTANPRSVPPSNLS